MMAVRRSKKWFAIIVINFQNDARSLAMRVTSWLSLKNFLTPYTDMVVHLFFALTVSIRRRLLFSALCWPINILLY
jgi:hypothetical protein